MIPNGSGVESTIRGMKTHFLYQSEVCLRTYTTLKKCVLHFLTNTTQILKNGIPGDGNIMCVCVCTKRLCVRNSEPKACTVGFRFKQYIRISVFVQSRIVHLFIVI